MNNPSAPIARKQAKHLLDNLSTTHPHIVLGPVLLEPMPGSGTYFVLGTIERDAWHFDQIRSEDRRLVEEYRAALTLELVLAQRTGIVLHDMADELQMVRLCDVILPSERTKRLAAAIEAERAESRQ